jgi:orotate phosphoribosyltransferase
VAGSKTLVIEDTLSTGGSAYEAAAALQAEGVQVLGVLSIFSYDFDAALTHAQQTGIPAYRLVTFETLIQTALRLGAIQDADVALLHEWRKAPDLYRVPDRP